jgi:hypothetical protein
LKTQNPNHRLTHIGGMALGLMSVVVLVWADVEDGKGGVSAGGKRVITQYYYITLCSIPSYVLRGHTNACLITVKCILSHTITISHDVVILAPESRTRCFVNPKTFIYLSCNALEQILYSIY